MAAMYSVQNVMMTKWKFEKMRETVAMTYNHSIIVPLF
jgi:hypothetical protein